MLNPEQLQSHMSKDWLLLCSLSLSSLVLRGLHFPREHAELPGIRPLCKAAPAYGSREEAHFAA